MSDCFPKRLFHCQQCVEKTAKYLIQLQGISYARGHVTDDYLEDLNDGAAKEMILSIALRIDRWGSQIRYHHSLMSNRKAVIEVFEVCKELIKMAEETTPKQLSENNLVWKPDTEMP